MPRTIWKGALNFGLVNVPVGLYPATKDKTVHFNQFEEGRRTASATRKSTSAPAKRSTPRASSRDST